MPPPDSVIPSHPLLHTPLQLDAQKYAIVGTGLPQATLYSYPPPPSPYPYAAGCPEVCDCSQHGEPDSGREGVAGDGWGHVYKGGAALIGTVGQVSGGVLRRAEWCYVAHSIDELRSCQKYGDNILYNPPLLTDALNRSC